MCDCFTSFLHLPVSVTSCVSCGFDFCSSREHFSLGNQGEFGSTDHGGSFQGFDSHHSGNTGFMEIVKDVNSAPFVDFSRFLCFSLNDHGKVSYLG